MTSTDLQRAAAQQANQPPIWQYIDSLRPEIARALPKGLDADRIARLALTVVRTTPKLALCTRESFAGALLSASAVGLEPNVNGEAYLVPYEINKKSGGGVYECQLIFGYQGFAKLFWQHPLAQHLDAQAVYPRDEFDYAYGTSPFLRHKPARDPDDSGPIFYYAVGSLTNGGSGFVVLTAEEVKKLRGGKVGPKGDIPDPQRWMERKTAVRQLVKLLPRSTQFTQALHMDERPGTELYREQVMNRQIEAPAHDPGTGEITDAQVVDEPVDGPAASPFGKTEET